VTYSDLQGTNEKKMTDSAPPRSALAAVAGALAGAVDRGYTLSRLLEGSTRDLLFSRGFDAPRLAALDARVSAMLGRLRAGRPALDGAPLRLEWAAADAPPRAARQQRAAARGAGCCSRRDAAPAPPAEKEVLPLRMREATAESPLADLLPPGAGRLHVLYVSDARAAMPWEEAAAAAADAPTPQSPPPPPPPPSSIVVIMPATGEEGFGRRLGVARELCAAAEAEGLGPVACILVTAPLYGARRPPASEGQRGYRAATVAAYQTASIAIMSEAAALLAWAHARAPRARLAITGFSYGAAMSSGAALLAIAALPRGAAARQLACSPYVGSASPLVLVDGLLAGDVDWAALAADSPGGSERVARLRLRSVLAAAHFGEFVGALRCCAGLSRSELALGAVVSVSMADDHFVPAPAARELHGVLAGVCAPARAEARRFDGGHRTADVHRARRNAAAAARALALLPMQRLDDEVPFVEALLKKGAQRRVKRAAVGAEAGAEAEAEAEAGGAQRK